MKEISKAEGNRLSQWVHKHTHRHTPGWVSGYTDRQTDRHKHTHTHQAKSVGTHTHTHTHTHQAKSVGTHTQPLPHCAALLGKLRLTPSSPGNRFSAQRMNIKMSSFFTPFPLFMFLSCYSSPKHDKKPSSSEAQYVPSLWEPPASVFLSQKASWPGRAHWKMQCF